MSVPWRDVITATARHLNTSIDTVEGWDIDKFVAYGESVRRVLKAEAGPQPRRSRVNR